LAVKRKERYSINYFVEDGRPLGCSAGYPGRSFSTFYIFLLPPSSGLMMEAVQTYETSINSYQSTRRYNP
jgi:hypothetical protein